MKAITEEHVEEVFETNKREREIFPGGFFLPFIFLNERKFPFY